MHLKIIDTKSTAEWKVAGEVSISDVGNGL